MGRDGSGTREELGLSGKSGDQQRGLVEGRDVSGHARCAQRSLGSGGRAHGLPESKPAGAWELPGHPWKQGLVISDVGVSAPDSEEMREHGVAGMLLHS